MFIRCIIFVLVCTSVLFAAPTGPTLQPPALVLRPQTSPIGPQVVLVIQTKACCESTYINCEKVCQTMVKVLTEAKAADFSYVCLDRSAIPDSIGTLGEKYDFWYVPVLLILDREGKLLAKLDEDLSQEAIRRTFKEQGIKLVGP